MIHEICFGGAEKVAIEEALALNSLGHEAVLIVLRKTGSFAFKDQLANVRRIFFSDLLPWPLRVSFRIPFFRFFSLFHLTYAIFARFVSIPVELDAIIAHGTYTCFSGVAAARRKGIPLLAVVWDPVAYILKKTYFQSQLSRKTFVSAFALTIGRMIDSWICRESAMVLTGSRDHAEILQISAPSPEKVKIVVPGARVRQAVSPKRKDYAMLATAWKEGKEPEYLLEVAERLEHVEFLVVGGWTSETFKNRFLTELARSRIGDRISVIGAVDENTLLDLYSQALVFLQLRADVGFGLPALEAAGQGCTFIIPAGQGVCNIFTDGTDGFFVREKDTSKIVEHLSTIFRDHATAVRMGKNAWVKAHSFSWEKHVEDLVNTCNALLLDSLQVAKRTIPQVA